MRLILTIFIVFGIYSSLLSQVKVWEKNFSSSSRYHTLGDLALTSDSSKLLMAVTDAVGRIEVNVLDTSGIVLKQMWHGRTDCTSWEYKASSIIEFNGNYVVGCSSDASCFLSTGAFLLVLDTNLNVLQEIELPNSYRSLTDIVSTLKVDQEKLFVTYSESGEYWFCELDTNYIIKSRFSLGNGLSLSGDNLNFCSPNLFGLNFVSYDITNSMAVASGVQIDYELNQIDTFNHFQFSVTLSIGNNVAYYGERPQVIENSCENQLLFLNKSSISVKNGEDLSIINSNNNWINNVTNVVSIRASIKLNKGGYASLLSIQRNGEWSAELVRFDYLLQQFSFINLGNNQWNPSIKYRNRIIDAGNYIYLAINQIANDSNSNKESFMISKIAINELKTDILEHSDLCKTSISPNPSNGIFRLLSEKPISGILKIYTLNGEQIRTTNVNNQDDITFDISGLPNAFYLVKFESIEMNQTFKVIKN
jgi:hypothetical protein